MFIQNNVIYLVAASIAVYGFSGWRLFRQPDPGAQYGFSVGPLIAGGIAVATFILGIIILWIFSSNYWIGYVAHILVLSVAWKYLGKYLD
jgi:hypothetical protein